MVSSVRPESVANASVCNDNEDNTIESLISSDSMQKILIDRLQRGRSHFRVGYGMLCLVTNHPG